MKIKVNLSCLEDNYQKKYQAKLLDRNIIVDDENRLPNYAHNFINFVADYSPAYVISSNGLVNTRFRYPENSGEPGKYYVYCRLNWLQRQKLAIITQQSWFHKHPLVTWGLILNCLFALVNIFVAYKNYQSNLKGLESSYLEVINRQIELQEKQLEQQNRQFEALERKQQ